MKKILFVLAMAGLSTSAMAQQKAQTECDSATDSKYRVITNKFWDNWFISGGIGGEFLIGNNDAHASFSDRISPTFNVSVGKWFTPGLGVRLQYSGYEARGSRKGAGSFTKGDPDQWGYYKQKFHYMNLHGDVLFNLGALFAGYNPKRVYEPVLYAGAGLVHVYSGSHQPILGKSQALSLNLGLINKFRLSNALDLNLELGSMLTQNKFDREEGGKKDFDGVLSATVGVTYYFKKRGFDKPVKTKQLISESELRDLRDRMGALAAENQNLKNELAKGPKVITKEVKADCPAVANTVFFALNSSVVNSREEFVLGIIAEQMKNDSDLKVNLYGYADSATGTASINDELSNRRAQAVADVLVKKYGVDAKRITFTGKGGVDKYNPIYLNRQVRIELSK